jgi:hypothetical protein
MGTVCRVWQYVWASLNTILGLFFVVVWPRQTTLQIVDGVIEIYGPATRRFLRRVIPLPQGAAALTIGHVVIACDPICLERTRAHERVHVWQYGRWGPFFLPLYGSASLIALAQGKNAYDGNWFEAEARSRSTTCGEGLGMVGGGLRLPLAGR